MARPPKPPTEAMHVMKWFRCDLATARRIEGKFAQLRKRRPDLTESAMLREIVTRAVWR